MSSNFTEGSGENLNFSNEQIIYPFAVPTTTSTPRVLNSFHLTSEAAQGSSKIFTNASKSDIPNGSIVIIGGDHPSYDARTVLDHNTDGSFSISPSLSKPFAPNSLVFLIAKPEETYYEDNSPCKVIFDYEDLYNLSLGLGKTYTFTFNSRDSFDQFKFLNYGDHNVSYSYPTITVKTSAIGPKSFTYKTASRYGKVSIDKSCDICSDLNFEIFSSDDSILYYNDVRKYLMDCGSSEFSQDILDVRVINCDCGKNTFLVTYCCDNSQDVSTDYCIATWNTICKDDISGIIEINPPSLSCKPHSTIFDRWYYSSSTNSLIYNRKIHFCYKGCTSYDFHPTFLIEPTQPTDEEWINCPCHAPTPTESQTSTASHTGTPQSYASNNYADNSTQGVHLAGDKPHFNNSSCLVGNSKVLTKANSTDLTDRVFYKDSENGYFYEEYGMLRNAYPTSTTSVDSKEVNGFNFYIKDETSIQKNTKNKGVYVTSPNLVFFYDALIPKREYDNFVSLVDYENPPPTPTIPVDNNLVKDKSLFYKLFTKPLNTYTTSNLINSTIAQLNWKYWFSDLPKLVYGSDTWWAGLDQSEMPSFEIIQSSNDLSKSQYNFEFNKTKVYPTISNGKFLSDNFSLIHLKSLPSDFSTSANSRHYVQTFQDPIYGVKVDVGSPYVKLIVEYSFTPKTGSISSSYSSLTYPIKRKEEVNIHLNPYSGNWNNTVSIKGANGIDGYPYNYGKDKTLGVTNPIFNLIQGRGQRYL